MITTFPVTLWPNVRVTYLYFFLFSIMFDFFEKITLRILQILIWSSLWSREFFLKNILCFSWFVRITSWKNCNVWTDWFWNVSILHFRKKLCIFFVWTILCFSPSKKSLDHLFLPFLPLVPWVTCACETVIVIAFQPSVILVVNCLAHGPRLKWKR